MKKILLLAVLIFGANFLEASTTEMGARESAYNVLKNLVTLPNNPEAISMAHQQSLKEKMARNIIREYAVRRKTGLQEVQNATIYKQDIREALEELNGAINLLADRMYGNNDGMASSIELKKLREEAKTNPGLKVLVEMTKTYSKLK